MNSRQESGISIGRTEGSHVVKFPLSLCRKYLAPMTGFNTHLWK